MIIILFKYYKIKIIITRLIIIQIEYEQIKITTVNMKINIK